MRDFMSIHSFSIPGYCVEFLVQHNVHMLGGADFRVYTAEAGNSWRGEQSQGGPRGDTRASWACSRDLEGRSRGGRPPGRTAGCTLSSARPAPVGSPCSRAWGCLKTRGRHHSPGVRSEMLRSHRKCEGIGRSCGWAPGAGTAARPQHGLRAVLVTLEQLEGSNFFLGGETCEISGPRPRLRRPLAAGSGHRSIPRRRGGETPPQTPAAANPGQGSRCQHLRHVTE